MNNNPLNDLPQNEWDALINSILKPFYSLCKKDALLTPEDLQQEAWLGLLAACENYDPQKGKFITFGYTYIRGHVMRFVAQKTMTKPSQLEITEENIDSSFYHEDTAEREDIMKTIMGKISDQEHAFLLEEHFVRGKSLRQIARERNVSHEAISSRVRKLLDILELRLNNANS